MIMNGNIRHVDFGLVTEDQFLRVIEANIFYLCDSSNIFEVGSFWRHRFENDRFFDFKVESQNGDGVKLCKVYAYKK